MTDVCARDGCQRETDDPHEVTIEGVTREVCPVCHDWFAEVYADV